MIRKIVNKVMSDRFDYAHLRQKYAKELTQMKEIGVVTL
jgi:hypothetical protein